jgi:pimeloyl-ACP methyl ester carboxylesterase
MNAMKAHYLNVPGARLYYETRGSGPVLLLLPGGTADARIFAGIAPLLADRYTVVTYDPRGLSRSTLDVPPEDARIVETFADDAQRLLGALGSEQAFVFGSSGGALIGLDLAARHPRQVRMLVAHEPPAAALLSDGPALLAGMDDVYDTYRAAGAGSAMQRFVAVAGLGGTRTPAASAPQEQPRPEQSEAMTQMQQNIEFFLAHYLRVVTRYQPDIAALKAGSTRVMVAVGDASQGQLAYRGGIAVAEQLGTEVAVFPGNHVGFVTRPAEFAETLQKVLAAG